MFLSVMSCGSSARAQIYTRVYIYIYLFKLYLDIGCIKGVLQVLRMRGLVFMCVSVCAGLLRKSSEWFKNNYKIYCVCC